PAHYHRLLMVGFCLVLTGLAAVFWRVRNRLERAAKWSGVLLPVFLMAAPAIMMSGGGGGGSFLSTYILGHERAFLGAIVFTNLAAVAAVVVIVGAVRSWVTTGRATGVRYLLQRIHMSAVALGGLMILAFLWFYNLIGVNLP
ncbi:MAG: hypothetical protein WEB93_00515, partial [Sphingomonadales bacterium]